MIGRICRSIVITLVVGLLAACSPRGAIGFGDAPPDAIQQQVWVAQFRSQEDPRPGDQTPPRPDQLRFENYVISIPPGHQTGQIEWPRGKPNGATDFVTVSRTDIAAVSAFASNIAKADRQKTGTTLLFIHGYNNTHGEAVYQGAQLAHDFDVPSPVVVFSWPSAGQTAGYLYDRDSVLIARDQLEEVIIALSRQSDRRLEIVAHSMGNFLIMETLRQIEKAGRFDIKRHIKSLTMVSPDIDGELFYTQASYLSDLPQESVILAARQDIALRVSAWLTGRSNRLGSATDRVAVKDLPITVVDTSDLSDGGFSHKIPFSSIRAIELIKMLDPRIRQAGAVTDRVIRLVDER
ncbi:MAG: alpha/beta hydrolase [Pseudomonadota bacterium]